MKNIFLLSAMLLHCLSAVAQSTFSGSITDGESPLVGATVQITGTFFIATSDSEGRFKIEGISSGTYPVQVRFVGYNAWVDTLDISGDLDLGISLSQSNSWTDEVIISATRAERESPTTYSNYDRDYLQKNNLGQDAPFLLNWTPSVVTTSDAGNGVGYTGMRIRGSDQTRINVTINGIPYNDAESHQVFWVDIPDIASSTENVQVQRGVGTSTNGAGAFGGTVNLQTLNVSNDPYGQIDASYGSFNTRKISAQAGSGLINKHWVFEGKFSVIGSDGYVDRASSELNSYYGSGSYVGKNSVFKLIAFGGRERTYQSWFGIDSATLANDRTFNPAGQVVNPDFSTRLFYDNQVDDYDQDHLQFHFSQNMGEGMTLNAALHYTHGRGFFEEYQDVNQPWMDTDLAFYRIRPLIVGDTVINNTDLVRRKWLDNHFYGITSSLNYTRGRSNLVFGFAANQYDGAHFGEVIWTRYASNSELGHRYYDNNSIKNDLTAYVKWNFKLSPRFLLFADLQYRRVFYRAEGIDEGNVLLNFNDEFNFFNPKLGVTYNLNQNTDLYASIAVGNREPNRGDYIDNLDDEKPKAETLYDLEVGYRRRGQKSAYQINFYSMYYQNQLVLTGELNNVGAPIRQNVGESFRNGIELNAQFLLGRYFQWSPNLTLSSNTNIDFVWGNPDGSFNQENTPIAFSPSVIGASQFSFLPIKHLEISLLSKYVGKQYLNNENVERLTLDPYFINDLRVMYRIFPKSIKEVSLTLLVNNITDTEYVSNGYVFFGQPYYYPQAGRNYLLGLRAKF